jgi:hypothetical protein
MVRKALFLGCIALGMAATVSMAEAASADLKPGFNVKNGRISVSNAGDAPAGRTYATIECATTVPAGCPEPAAAALAPYQNASFPNAATVKFNPLKAGQTRSHKIAFYKDLVWAPGTYWLTVCVDAGDHVAEANEGNNCRRFKKRVLTPSLGVAARTR